MDTLDALETALNDRLTAHHPCGRLWPCFQPDDQLAFNVGYPDGYAATTIENQGGPPAVHR